MNATITRLRKLDMSESSDRSISTIERAARKLAQDRVESIPQQAKDFTASADDWISPAQITARPPVENEPRFSKPSTPKPRDEAPVNQVNLDLALLSRAGIYSPEQKANRTTEEFRLIKHAVLARIQGAEVKDRRNANVVMVTSTLEAEGKSFVAANLAMSIAAERDKSVILVDADPSRSAVAKTFSIASQTGLLDVLENLAELPDVILTTNIPGLSLIPAGPKRPLSAELYASERAVGFLEQLVARYPTSIVVFDAPPILATGEPSALAQHVGQIVFVVEAERTGQAAIVEALNLVNSCPNIGFVLNKAKFRFGSVRFGAYYDNYYAR